MDYYSLGGITISKICNNCGAENNNESKFCYKCATDIKDIEPEKEITLADDEKQCPNCKAINNIEAKFCKNCAKSFFVEVQAEQGQVAIHNEQSNNIQNEQVSSSEILQNMAQPVLNKSIKKNIPMPLLIGIIAIVVIAVVAVIIAGNKKPSAPAAKPQTSISTTANTTTQNTTKESITELTTQTTTTEATTKNDYSQLLSDTIWTYYFDETDQYSIIEFVDENSLHYYEQDGYTAIINEDLWASYEINGNELTIHTSGTNETQVYKIKVTIADKNNLSGTDCIKIQGNGTINPVEYYYG